MWLLRSSEVEITECPCGQKVTLFPSCKMAATLVLWIRDVKAPMIPNPKRRAMREDHEGWVFVLLQKWKKAPKAAVSSQFPQLATAVFFPKCNRRFTNHDYIYIFTGGNSLMEQRYRYDSCDGKAHSSVERQSTLKQLRCRTSSLQHAYEKKIVHISRSRASNVKLSVQHAAVANVSPDKPSRIYMYDIKL